MDALNPITWGRRQIESVTQAGSEPEVEVTTPPDDGCPEAFNIVPIKDIWSDLEVCRASALWNLSSYLKQTRSLGFDEDAPEPSAAYLVMGLTREPSTRSDWRAKIDKDDLRRDLLEIKTILDFIASRNNASSMGLSWCIASVLTGLTAGAGTIMPTASPVLMKGFLALSIFSSGMSIKQCYTKLRKWMAARSCQQTVQQLLDAIEDGTLEQQDADVLEGGDFRILLRLGRQ